MFNLMSFSPSSELEYFDRIILYILFFRFWSICITNWAIDGWRHWYEWSSTNTTKNNYYSTTHVVDHNTTTDRNYKCSIKSDNVDIGDQRKVWFYLLNEETVEKSVFVYSIEPLPFPQHGPGPIQRPNKLSCPLTIQASSVFRDSPRSPDTPDVLVHINHLVDRQNSFATVMPNTDTPLNNSSNMSHDMSTPNVPWTPFSPSDWSSKYESSWPVSVQTPNPFASRQISSDETNIWPEPSLSSSWLKFPSTAPSNRQENETPNQVSSHLRTVLPSSIRI